jgi:hypothetical protein
VATKLGRCLTCDYPLHGLAEPRCPECGRSFDPRRPETMNFARHAGPVARWLMSPIGWPTYAAFIAVALLAQWLTREQDLSMTASNLFLPVVLFALLAVTQMVWMVIRAAVSDLLAVRPGRPDGDDDRTDSSRWLRLWVIYGLLVIPLTFSLSFRINFARSRSRLDAFAQQTLAARAAPSHAVWIGGFYVRPSSVTLIGRDVLSIRITSQSGLAYDPSGLLERVPHERGATGVGAHWFWWESN